MSRVVTIIILLSLTSFNQAVTFLPSIFWDTNNPILQRQYWDEVVQVQIHDRLTFICPNDIIKISGREVKQGAYANGLYHNLYVKEIPEDMTNFDEACDTSENSTAVFITNCDQPKKFYYKNIPINVNQAHPDLPKFKYGKDYMFFATSDGSMESIQQQNTTSKNCTMVFRIHFNTKEEKRPMHSCPLFNRENVCGKQPSKQEHPKEKECKSGTPKELNTTATADNNVIVTWQAPSNSNCSITHYTICYRDESTALCHEELVTGEKHSATLCKLTANHKYFIKVRAHTSKGPGEYSKEVTFETSQDKEPDVSALKEKKGSSIDGKSIAIGFVIGFFVTIMVVIAFWVFITRIYNKKKEEEKEEESNKNNPNFYKGEDELSSEITINTGYRESGQNWKLPAVQEENLHLYCSDA